MPQASPVSEKVWAQAIHAVIVEKLSLRRAAQLYGVHHMSLYRRVRGRNVGATASSRSTISTEFALSQAEQDEVLLVLRDQFLHGHQVTSDDVRYVVRTIASQSGRRDLPSGFPPNRWIAAFKRVHGVMQPVSSTTAGAVAGSNVCRGHGVSGSRSSPHSSITSGAVEQGDNNAIKSSRLPGATTMMYTATDSRQSLSVVSPSQMNASLAPPQKQQRQFSYGCVAVPRNHSCFSGSERAGNGDDDDDSQTRHDSTSETDSESIRDSIVSDDMDDTRENDKRNCRQSNAVSTETWEKAMDAVEIHGMSLRNAAKAYGVHYGALHRRVKKRARQEEAAQPPLDNYIPFEDEAGIVRVIHARADLGVLMSYEELVDVLVRTKLKYVAAVSAELSSWLIRQFQSRFEHSIRHLICYWPLPRLDSLCRFGPQSAQLQLQLRQHGRYTMEKKLWSPPPLTPQALLSPASHQQNGYHNDVSSFDGHTGSRNLESPTLLDGRARVSYPLVSSPRGGPTNRRRASSSSPSMVALRL
jgi:transposase|uniref:HTH psq-type domain-containing protein n=1 Tax=Globisporangium ultimum (strain ATCC 200006 / CBS 805.95 / DAOM BR144) TaxID=431595 RepID=K3WYS2_GLOUD